jgi:outer membrane biosynthesis protein TonB
MATKTDSTSKVPRFAVIQGGKVIEDRILDKHQSVNVGSEPKNTIVVPLGDLPKAHTILEWKGAGYSLLFTDKMDGKVSVQANGEKVSFDTLKTSGTAKKRGDVFELPLNEGSKGSVSLGEVTLLFQFVTPPKPVAPLQLPSAAKGSFFTTIDRTFSGILAAFLLVEFSGAYALSLRKINDDEITLDELPDRFVKLVVPEKPKEPPKDDKPKEVAKTDEPKADKPKEVAKADKPKEAPTKSHEEVVKKVQSSGILAILGSTANGKGIPGLDVNSLAKGLDAHSASEALSGAKGLSTADGDMVGARGGDGPRGGKTGEAVGIGKVGTEGGTADNTGEKKAVNISGHVTDAEPDVSGDVDREGLARYVKARLKSIQSCYERELKRNSSLKGKIVVRFTIGSNGRTKEVEIDENKLGSDEVGNCIRTIIKTWTFPFKPESDVTLSYPFVFSPASN